MLLYLRIFAGGGPSPSGVIHWGKALWAVWPGLAFASLPPLQGMLGCFEASGIIRLNDIQPGAFMSMWKCLSGAAGQY